MKGIVFILAIVVAGWMSHESQSRRNPVRIACLGDSIAHGSGTLYRKFDSYPCQLNEMLPEKYKVVNFGVGGTNWLIKGEKPYIKEGMLKRVLEFKPNIVTLQFGINDTKPETWAYHHDLKEDIIALVKTLQTVEELNTILIFYPPPAFADKFNIQLRYIKSDIIPVISQASKETGVEIIDLYYPLLERPDLYHDQVHPNLYGARLIAKILYERITGKPYDGKKYKGKVCEVNEDYFKQL